MATYFSVGVVGQNDLLVVGARQDQVSSVAPLDRVDAALVHQELAVQAQVAQRPFIVCAPSIADRMVSFSSRIRFSSS